MMSDMWHSISLRYLRYEADLIQYLQKFRWMREYTQDPISARITLFLLVVGSLAFLNELYITIEMSCLQKGTYSELNRAKLDATNLKNHRMILDDEFHGREWRDEKRGIVIEEFESRDRFFAKPVHVAHLYAKCNIRKGEDGPELLSQPFQFHIEFSPEEYEYEKRPEFGCKLIVLRRKLYHFFKDSKFYQEFVAQNSGDGNRAAKFTVSDGVRVYNPFGELLRTEVDDIQLCFLKIETGDSIKCTFVIEE